MALATYDDLKTSALDWMTRSGQSGVVEDWITLAEARLNRELGAVETDASLTGTEDSRTIDISSLSMVQPVALFLAPVGEDEQEVTPRADGAFAYLDSSGRPRFWGIDGTNIDFDRPLDEAYPFRLHYRQRFSLATSSTNWLLTNHPDIYLAAVLMWGAGYNEDFANGATWKAVLDEGIPDVRNSIAQSRRGSLTVDRALATVGRRSYDDLVNNG